MEQPVEVMETNLMIVTQLPVIEENLKQLGDELQGEIDLALSMPCTEESKPEVKRVRAKLNKKKAEFEAQRIAVKTAIMEPYERVNDLCKTYVLNRLADAETKLAKRIAEIEDAEKARKQKQVETYFAELLEAAEEDVSFLTFERMGLKVGLSDTEISLKKAAKSYVDQVVDSLKMIAAQVYADEILVEYKKSMNAFSAVTTVSERHKAIEAEQARKAVAEALQRDIAEKARNVVEVGKAAVMDAVGAKVVFPTVVEQEDAEPEPMMTVSFRVTATRTKLIALKTYLAEGDYQYE